MLLSLFLAS